MTKRRSSGVALLALLALLGLVAALFVYGIAGNLIRRNETDQRTADALAQAKAALIGYAGNYPDEHAGRVFGYLPCPDVSGIGGEGVAAGACGGTDVTVVGRLPWKTLELPPLRDGSGECLWYAVSGSFKYNPSTSLLNWDTNGLINVMAPDGTNFLVGGSGTTVIQTRRAAAVIFAPGAILPGQDRSLAAVNPPEICGGNYNVANYLDTDTASTINNAAAASATANALSTFVAAFNSNNTAAAANTFNDRLVTISPQDIFMRLAQKRADFESRLTDPGTGMLRRVADCLVLYSTRNSNPADKRLPWAAPISLNNVGTVYGNNSNYADGPSPLRYSGRQPFLVATSASTTNNFLETASPDTNELLTQSTCPGWDAATNAFWNNWKDHVFYAVAEAYAPDSPNPTPANPCTLRECITVDGLPGFAAVVIFAGMKQSGQSRNNDANPAYTSADKSDAANYLEGVNSASILQNTPSLAAPRQFSKIAGNDTVMCVSDDPVIGMTVDPTCSATSQCSQWSNLVSGLAQYRVGNSNNCKVGTKDVSVACQALADNISRNNCSCKKDAKKFISKKCLDGFTDPKCQQAYDSLTIC